MYFFQHKCHYSFLISIFIYYATHLERPLLRSHTVIKDRTPGRSIYYQPVLFIIISCYNCMNFGEYYIVSLTLPPPLAV